uniref:Uncharacterized protein n=1 Tax=Onchocerca volvulus TaxID=6282 RepID=A0A8R1TN75_ONCVO
MTMKLYLITSLLLAIIHQNIALPNDTIATSSTSYNIRNSLEYIAKLRNKIYNYFWPNLEALRQIVSIPAIRNHFVQYLENGDLDKMVTYCWNGYNLAKCFQITVSKFCDMFRRIPYVVTG